MWFKRKTKEEKQKEKEDKEIEKVQKLQAELIHLKTKYANEINLYCKINNFIFVLHGFMIRDNKIMVQLITSESTLEYHQYLDINWFEFNYGTTDFKKARLSFLKFKDELSKIGLKLEKI